MRPRPSNGAEQRNCHRSHFGSRYTLGYCCKANLLPGLDSRLCLSCKHACFMQTCFQGARAQILLLPGLLAAGSWLARLACLLACFLAARLAFAACLLAFCPAACACSNNSRHACLPAGWRGPCLLPGWLARRLLACFLAGSLATRLACPCFCSMTTVLLLK